MLSLCGLLRIFGYRNGKKQGALFQDISPAGIVIYKMIVGNDVKRGEIHPAL